jgi:arsenate reductase
MGQKLQFYFLCGQNRCRSQMAEAFAQFYGHTEVIVHSAGLNPSDIHPLTVQAMKEIGIDISNHHSKKIDMKIFLSSTVIVKLCDGISERCPVVPFGIRNEQWSINDPLDGENPSIESVRAVRDEIKQKVISLLHHYNAHKS